MNTVDPEHTPSELQLLKKSEHEKFQQKDIFYRPFKLSSEIVNQESNEGKMNAAFENYVSFSTNFRRAKIKLGILSQNKLETIYTKQQDKDMIKGLPGKDGTLSKYVLNYKFKFRKIEKDGKRYIFVYSSGEDPETKAVSRNPPILQLIRSREEVDNQPEENDVQKIKDRIQDLNNQKKSIDKQISDLSKEAHQERFKQVKGALSGAFSSKSNSTPVAQGGGDDCDCSKSKKSSKKSHKKNKPTYTLFLVSFANSYEDFIDVGDWVDNVIETRHAFNTHMSEHGLYHKQKKLFYLTDDKNTPEDPVYTLNLHQVSTAPIMSFFGNSTLNKDAIGLYIKILNKVFGIPLGHFQVGYADDETQIMPTSQATYIFSVDTDTNEGEISRENAMKNVPFASMITDSIQSLENTALQDQGIKLGATKGSTIDGYMNELNNSIAEQTISSKYGGKKRRTKKNRKK